MNQLLVLADVRARRLIPITAELRDSGTMPLISRAIGPYRDRAKWRLIVFQDGTRASVIFDTLEEANATKSRLLTLGKTDDPRTVGDALEAYLDAQQREGLKAATLRTVTYRLQHFLPLDLTLSKFTQEEAQKLYTQETERTGRWGKPIAAATHRAALKDAKLMFRWLVAEKWLPKSPFEHIKAVGRVNAGKPQLRLDEARKLNAFLIKEGQAGDEGATAVLTQLVLGMRSNEVLSRRVRDLDSLGQALFIERGKTKNARRSLKVQSPALRALLLKQAQGRKPEDLLFGAERSTPHNYDYLWHRLGKYCERAGVPRVCPHSLRGLHSTLAIEEGATSGLVANALGHGSFAVTARHYVEPSALENARLRTVKEALEPAEASLSPELEGLRGALAKLPQDQLAALLRSLGKAG